VCAGHLGSVVANTVRVFKPDQLPLLLVISRTRGIPEVVQVLHGTLMLLAFNVSVIRPLQTVCIQYTVV